jgi:hypothetical protein
MDIEAPGMDRLDPRLAERDPIGVGDAFGNRLDFAALGTSARTAAIASLSGLPSK